MSCEICGRGSCTRTFHSIAEQEAFDSEAGAAERALFDKISDLELTCRAQTAAITALRAALDKERADNEKLRACIDELRQTSLYAPQEIDAPEVLDRMWHHEMVFTDGDPTALLSGRGED